MSWKPCCWPEDQKESSAEIDVEFIIVHIFEWSLIHLVEANLELTLAMLLTETAMLLLCNIVNTEWVVTKHKSVDLFKSTEAHNSQWSTVLTQLSVISNSTILYTVPYMLHSLTSPFQ